MIVLSRFLNKSSIPGKTNTSIPVKTNSGNELFYIVSVLDSAPENSETYNIDTI